MIDEYIESDGVFMNHVAYCGDRYQERDSFLNEEKNNFQKVLDKVRPKKKFIRCSEEDCIKYKLDFNRDISNTLDYEKCYMVLLDHVKDKTTDEKVSFFIAVCSVFKRNVAKRKCCS